VHGRFFLGSVVLNPACDDLIEHSDFFFDVGEAQGSKKKIKMTLMILTGCQAENPNLGSSL
jgi:hypothetical protein